MKASRVLLLASLGLAGCGRVDQLQPAAGKALPVKPMMARTTPSAIDLLTPPPYARPIRVDDVVTRSTPRQPDPFDLPPPAGGAAPALPAGTNPGPVANDTGVTPGE